MILYKTELVNAQCLLSCLSCWLAEKSLSFSNGLDLKGGLSDIWISFLLFLDKIDISEHGGCVVVALESEDFANNFIIVYFAGKIDGSGNEMKQNRQKKVSRLGGAAEVRWNGGAFLPLPLTLLSSLSGILTGCHPRVVNSHEEKKKWLKDFRCQD